MSKNGNKELNVVGKPFRKVDARAKCTGQTKFADDIFLPRMLFCKILRSHEPHALIKSIDSSKASALPGVIAIITGKDLPIPYGILPVSQDEHALCIDKVRFIGDPVAAVAAIDEDAAFDAMNLIEVEYERLQTITSIEEGVMIDEPRIHEYGDGGNVHKKVSLESRRFVWSYATVLVLRARRLRSGGTPTAAEGFVGYRTVEKHLDPPSCSLEP